jgi:hypothetical protein
MALFLIIAVSFLLLWLVLDIHAERLTEKARFLNKPKLNYFQVGRSYFKELCSIKDEEELSTLIWFSQSILVLIALAASAMVWALYLPLNAIAVTVLSLFLAMILPRRVVKYWKKSASKKIQEEVGLASMLLMLRARPDESVSHVVYDVVEAMPKGRKGTFAGSLLSSLNSFRSNGQFIEAMDKLNSQIADPSVKRMSNAMSSWYADAEQGSQNLDVLVREQEAVRQIKLDLGSNISGFLAGAVIIIVFLLITFLYTSQL